MFSCSPLLVFIVSEMGRVHRNCTEDGWSEPMPHYVDACIFYDNATKPVRTRLAHVQLSSQVGLRPCFHDCLSPTSGHVLRLSQGPVHRRLQHFAGVSDHGHGHPLQVQVFNAA